MKRCQLFTFACIAVIMMTSIGCVQSRIVLRGSPPDGPIPVGDNGPIEPDDQATITQIDACEEMLLSSLKTWKLKKIAARHDLGRDAQCHMVDAAFDVPTFEHQRTDVLYTLAINAVFCESAKAHILERIDELKQEKNRKKMLNYFDCRKKLRVFDNG